MDCPPRAARGVRTGANLRFASGLFSPFKIHVTCLTHRAANMRCYLALRYRPGVLARHREIRHQDHDRDQEQGAGRDRSQAQAAVSLSL